MSKRERHQPSTSVEGSQAKKRKDENLTADDAIKSDPTAEANARAGEGSGTKEQEKELANSQGLVLWQTVKDAVNKEDRVLSVPFMQKPSKKYYADYYQQIKHPVFLDDIKKKLDSKGYSSFEAVKQDFELCFINAKNYNLRNSQIWKDAKHLHKLVLKEYARIVPSEDSQVDVDGEAGGDGGNEKKAKAPNMYRMLKSRLTKLVERTDDDGRILSQAFMELPSKKEWAIYYKEIKRPQCIENIFKRLKRKEYFSSSDFAADVELVFSNAMQFNQEHSVIWNDAKVLRDYFRQLMSDLPAPFALPEYSKPSKIKLKMPAPAATSTSAAPPPQLPSSNSVTSSGGLLLRVPSNASTQNPAAADTKAKGQARPAESPAPAAAPRPPPASIAGSVAAASGTRPQAPPAPPKPAPAPSTASHAITQLLSYSNASYYPNASYAAPSVTHGVPAPGSSTPKTSLVSPFVNRTGPARSVTPPPVLQHPLKGVMVKVEPPGRQFKLDHLDGVKSWALRLGRGENSLALSDVMFLGVEEEESSGEEEEDRKEEEEEDEHSAETDAPLKNGKRKGRGKGKGKGKMRGLKAKVTASEKGKAKENAVKKAKMNTPALEDVQVKLDGTIINPVEEGKGNWHVDVPIGSHIIEVGAKGGTVWKLFAERIGD